MNRLKEFSLDQDHLESLDQTLIEWYSEADDNVYKDL